MRKIIITTLTIFIFNSIISQDQETGFSNAKRDMYAQFTQYSNILALLNPAYCGTSGGLNLFFITREQWGGSITGAPVSIATNLNGMFTDYDIGWGFSLLYEQYGAQRYFDFSMATDYIISIDDDSKLSIGFQFSVNTYDIDQSEFEGGELPKDVVKSGYIIPNFGFGIFYYTNNFYAGISSPELMKYEENSGKNDFANVIFDLKSAIFFTYIGYGDVLSEDFDYKATVLNKFALTPDLGFEINTLLTYKKKIGFGVGYRIVGSIIGMLEFEVFKGLDFGYSYDIPVRETNINYGSHEIRFNYSFEYEQVEIESSIRYW